MTAYEMRISDWSSDVCSSDLNLDEHVDRGAVDRQDRRALAGRQRPDYRRLFAVADEPLVADDGHLAGDRQRAGAGARDGADLHQIGRASCRERGCQYGLIQVVAESFKKKETTYTYVTCTKNTLIN